MKITDYDKTNLLAIHVVFGLGVRLHERRKIEDALKIQGYEPFGEHFDPEVGVAVFSYELVKEQR